jgi:uncharacterized repeat protein (TIGR03803 family)
MHRVQSVPLAILLGLIVSLYSAQAQTFTVIHSFSGNQDGATPIASLTIDAGGNIYGSTLAGGDKSQFPCLPGGCGVVFKLSRRNSSWTLNPLYSFTGGADGVAPGAPVSFGPGGLLYGSTIGGGAINSNCMGAYPGCGVVFTLHPRPTACSSVVCPWTENVIYQFANVYDGQYPQGSLAFDAAGNVYGTTSYGGSGACFGIGCGTVFQLSRSGSGWLKTTIANYNNGFPQGLLSGVIIDGAGNLFGSSNSGGDGNIGSVFEVTKAGSVWLTTLLHSFTSLATGAYADGGLVMDHAGNLYGTTAEGGPSGGGIVFELSPSVGGWNYSVIANLTGNPGLSGSYGSLAIDANGNLYGTTYSDGAFQCGNVFKLTPSDGQWLYTDLHDFTCGDDGGNPRAGVTLDSSGNIFGTTAAYGPSGNNCAAGANRCGVVWEITP